MCSNLSLRQKLLPMYMKASNEQEMATTMETMQEPPPVTSMPPAPSVPESSVMPAFRHPSLNRSTHRHLSQYAPTPMYHSMDSIPSAPAPVPTSVSTPVAVGTVPPPTSVPVASPVETTPAPSSTRSFGLAGKGPRVVAGVSRPVANRITKYNPHVGVTSTPVPSVSESAPLPTPATPLPTPTVPLPTPAAPLPTPAAPQSTPDSITTPFPPSTSQTPMIGTQKPLVKPKPAKP